MSCVTSSAVCLSCADDAMHVALEDELGLIVEGGERLVEQQDVRIGGQRADERHALTHAAGELIRIRVLEAGQAVGFQQLVRSPPRFGGALRRESRGRAPRSAAPCATRTDDPSAAGYPPARGCRECCTPSSRTCPSVGCSRPEMMRQQRGFPAAARPDDAAELTVADRQVQVLERQRLSGSGEISVGQAFAPDSLPSAHRLIV